MDRRFGVAALVLATTLVFAACSKDTPRKGTAKFDDVIAAANAACHADLAYTQKHIQDYKSRFGTGTIAEDQAKDFLVNTVAPDADDVRARLHAIPNPEKNAPQWRDMLDQVDKEVSDFKYRIDQDAVALTKSIGTHDPSKGTKAGEMLVAFGAKDCTTL